MGRASFLPRVPPGSLALHGVHRWAARKYFTHESDKQEPVGFLCLPVQHKLLFHFPALI